MTVRETSLQAYHTIKENGLLSQRRWEVYELLVKHGPGTASELHQNVQRGSAAVVGANIRARLHELKEAGVSAEIGERPCTVTGYMAIVWDVVDRLPKEVKPRKGRSCRECSRVKAGAVNSMRTAYTLIEEAFSPLAKASLLAAINELENG